MNMRCVYIFTPLEIHKFFEKNVRMERVDVCVSEREQMIECGCWCEGLLRITLFS
jgi:hypothetical protein